MLHDVLRDVRHALRLLRRAPGFTLLASVTLALGIGANTALFSVVHGLLLRPLPYPAPERLVFLDGAFARPEGLASFQLSYPEMTDIAASARSLSGAAPWSSAWGLALEGAEGAARLQANFVGRDYFAVLGARPMAGRVFTADEHAPGGDAMVAMLSEAVWRQHFGGDPAIVGREVRLQGRPFTIVGVMPSSFHDVALAYTERIDVWAPIERAPALFGGVDFANRGGRLMWGVARLADGVTLAEARAELETLGAQLATAYPQSNTSFTLRAAPLAQSFFADARRPLWLLLGGSIFVLLIGCANVANLLLVRSRGRAREIAVRLAIGASRGRVVRQLLIESTVLAAIGGGIGVLVAGWLTPALVTLSGIRLPGFAEVTIDATVLAMAVATAGMCGLLFGLAPVWQVSRASGRNVMAASGSPRIAASNRTPLWLAGLEVTAAFVLASGALMMLGSFSALTGTDLSFRHERLLTVRVDLPQDRYATPAARARFGLDARDRLQRLPGVEHAILWGPSMFARSTWVAFIAPEEQVVADHERLMVWRHSTNPGALRDLGIGLLEGRDLAATDTLDTPAVAVISQTTAQRLWPSGSAVGRRFRWTSGATSTTLTVVGIAADARHRGRFRFSQGAAAYEPQLDIYLPFAQRPASLVTIGVRTAGDPASHTRAVAAAIAAIDPALPLYDIATLASRMQTEESPVGFAALLMNIYGGLALILAAVGIYGVLAAGVSARLRELGIRSALGAHPRRLLMDVMGHACAVTAASVAVGLAIAWIFGRSANALLFGVSAADPRLLGAAAVLVMSVAAVASLVPARRAARVDPVEVLRAD